LTRLDHVGQEEVASLANMRDPIDERDLAVLVRLAADAQSVLMTGDAQTYLEMLAPTLDFTLMDPMGGAPTRGGDPSPERVERMGRFFRNGTADVELVAAYAGSDMSVLAMIERLGARIGDLPEQEWKLRVTLAFRREESGWRLVHRHADPLAGGISLEESAALARR
jgi:ketosteroid isomerase-like protein